MVKINNLFFNVRSFFDNLLWDLVNCNVIKEKWDTTIIDIFKKQVELLI